MPSISDPENRNLLDLNTPPRRLNAREAALYVPAAQAGFNLNGHLYDRLSRLGL
jgi:hypothetical protein